MRIYSLIFLSFFTTSVMAMDFVTVGSTSKDLLTYEPVVFNSSDQGLSWNVNTFLSYAPPSYTIDGFNDLECASEFCAAAGTYFPLQDLTPKIAILRGSEQEKNWMFIDQINPLYSSKANALNDIGCLSDKCYVVGNYQDSDKVKHFLAAESDASGHYWYQDRYVTNAPGSFQTLTCQKETRTCVAVGYAGIKSAFPIVVVKTPAEAWKQVNVPNLSKMALGKAIFANQAILIPFVEFGTSHDCGFLYNTGDLTNWSTVLLPKQKNPIYFTSLTCGKKLCVAAGQSNNNLQKLFISFDQGKTWHTVENLPASLKTYSGMLKNIACQGNTCAIAGFDFNNTNASNPFLWQLKVTNEGNISVQSASITGLLQTAPMTAIQIKCDQAICEVVGFYTDPVTQQHQPIFLRSTDVGLSWQQVPANGGSVKQDYYLLTLH